MNLRLTREHGKTQGDFTAKAMALFTPKSLYDPLAPLVKV